jgi:hypothetical protein
MLDIPLLLSAKVLLALRVVPVQVVILHSNLLNVLLGAPEFVLGVADPALAGAVLLPRFQLRLPDVLVGPFPVSACLRHFPLMLDDLPSELVQLALQLTAVLQFASQCQLQRVPLLPKSRH